MGVKGLTGFLKRHVPSQLIPSKLSHFSGQTLAVDGTLWTTKLHYSLPPTPAAAEEEEHRHAKAWYTFITALRTKEVKTIVVFDGPSRLIAKQREAERRRRERELQLARARAEKQRNERLLGIKDVWDDVSPLAQEDIVNAFRGAVSSPEIAQEGPIGRLVELHESFQKDKGNSTYSKFQKVVSVAEETYFQSLVETGRNEASVLEDLIVQSEKIEISHTRRSALVPRSAFLESRTILEAMGVPVLVPSADDPAEAEGLCATLCFKGYATAVLSEDTDVLLYGAPLLRRFSLPRSSSASSTSLPVLEEEDDDLAVTLSPTGKTSLHLINPSNFLEDLELSKEQFIDFALLCGTDFTRRRPSLGPETAYNLIKKHGDIQTIASYAKKYFKFPDQPTEGKEGEETEEEYWESIKVARGIFREAPALSDGMLNILNAPTSSNSSE